MPLNKLTTSSLDSLLAIKIQPKVIEPFQEVIATSQKQTSMRPSCHLSPYFSNIQQMLSVHRIPAAAQTPFFPRNHTVATSAPLTEPICSRQWKMDFSVVRMRPLHFLLALFSMQKSCQRPWDFAGNSLPFIGKGDGKQLLERG